MINWHYNALLFAWFACYIAIYSHLHAYEPYSSYSISLHDQMKFLIRVFDQRFINPRQTLVSPALALATRDKSLSQAQTDPFFNWLEPAP